MVEAADQDGWIEGSVLVDVCVQSSEVRGSGCDAPGVSMASPPSSPSQPAAQVGQYTCRPFSKERNVSDIRREYVAYILMYEIIIISLFFPGRSLTSHGSCCWTSSGRSGEASG